MKALKRIRFHVALYLNFFANREFLIRQLSKKVIGNMSGFPGKLDIFFWTPQFTPGAKVIVHDVMPTLVSLVQDLGLDWSIEFGETIPERNLNHLICFKSVPPDRDFRRHEHVAMLICDQAEVYWDDLPKFDDVVATSSIEFANLIAVRNRRTIFIPESEPVEYIKLGRGVLSKPPSKRGNIIVWHGGQYSLEPLYELRPILEKFASQHSVQLHIISGSEAIREERWGELKVAFFPWSIDRLVSSARDARISIIPAKKSIKLSYLKPASRVRCMFALGVPAVGDRRVPEVKRFCEEIGCPSAGEPDEWLTVLNNFWDKPDELDSLARKGFNLVKSEFTTEQTAIQWVRYFASQVRSSK